jgi:hypothetical protein
MKPLFGWKYTLFYQHSKYIPNKKLLCTDMRIFLPYRFETFQQQTYITRTQNLRCELVIPFCSDDRLPSANAGCGSDDKRKTQTSASRFLVRFCIHTHSTRKQEISCLHIDSRYILGKNPKYKLNFNS